MSQDHEFEKYLQGETDLSQRYADLPPVELPDHLDAAILAEAHRAVNARPGARPKRRWTIPLGLVASLIVAVMAGLQLPYMLKDAELAQQPGREKAAANAMDTSSAAPAPAAPEERKSTQVRGQANSGLATGAAAPMAAEVEAYARPATRNAPATRAIAEPSAGAGKRLELRESAEAESGMALVKEKKASAYAGGDSSDAIAPRAPEAATMAAPSPAQQPRALMQPLKDEASAASLSPQDWLARIQKLKQQGKLEEARKDLAAFKQRYPDYPVPEAIEVR